MGLKKQRDLELGMLPYEGSSSYSFPLSGYVLYLLYFFFFLFSFFFFFGLFLYDGG